MIGRLKVMTNLTGSFSAPNCKCENCEGGSGGGGSVAEGGYNAITTTAQVYDFTAVSDTLVNNSVATAQADLPLDKIAVSYSAEGGIAPYQYSCSYKLLGDTEWTDTGYTAETQNIISVNSSGTYIVNIKVKDAVGVIKERIVAVEVKVSTIVV